LLADNITVISLIWSIVAILPLIAALRCFAALKNFFRCGRINT
jgi:hypothetical protein